jgi:hypothetical protein
MRGSPTFGGQDKSAAVGRAQRIEVIRIFRLATYGAAVAFERKANDFNARGAVAGLTATTTALALAARAQGDHRCPILPGVT